MGSNNNQFTRVDASKNATATGKSGSTVDPGPYEAIVQGHAEGTRMGQLIVTIPDWSGIVGPEDGNGSQSDQITVSYASPFYGTTYGADTQQLPDGPATSGQSYGMWMIPPDIGCKVLVVFAGGDMSRGYWFACVYDSPSHHMVPAIGRNVGGTANTIAPDDTVKQYLSKDSIVPVVEYNTKSSTSFNNDGLVNTPRNPHEIQAMNYVKQGLDKDKIRGAISSSSMREAPSNVYGISTPGRRATKTDQISGVKQAVIYRSGGHQFVMDDGAEDGTDQLIRLRTSGGHQILMNDTENVLYIASNTGSQWMEFSPDGSINVYGAAGFNMRTQGPINMHSDSLIAMCAPNIKMDAVATEKSKGLPSIAMSSMGSFSAKAVMSASITADATLSLGAIGKVSVSAGASCSVSSVGALTLSSAGVTSLSGVGSVNIDGAMLMLNCSGPKPPLPPIPGIPTLPKSLPDSVFDGSSWSPTGILLSTLKVVPTHEPWERPAPAKGE